MICLLSTLEANISSHTVYIIAPAAKPKEMDNHIIK